jgi:hypothetical protein
MVGSVEQVRLQVEVVGCSTICRALLGPRRFLPGDAPG